MTAGSQNLVIKRKRKHWKYEMVKVVPTIAKNMFSVGKRPQYIERKLQLKCTGCFVYKNGK